MSRYARLVAPIKACEAAGSSPPHFVRSDLVELPIGTEIKSVRVVDGELSFWARLLGAWRLLRTDEDLPGATDRGRAYREARAKGATLRRGRPSRGETKATQRLACKVTVEQAAYVERCAAQLDTSVSEYVRRALIADGMPE